MNGLQSNRGKSNYSPICKRCGRKLKSEESRNRGYGSYCYNKMGSDKGNGSNKNKDGKSYNIKNAF